MASQQQENTSQTGWCMGAFWFAGVGLFMVELNAGLDYVQARLAALVPDFLGCLPAFGLAAWRVAESAFWKCGQLEAAFRLMPFVTLPFVLVLLALSMKDKIRFSRR